MRTRRTLLGIGLLCSFAVLILDAPTTAEEISQIAKSARRLETVRERPKAYGIEDYSVTVVPAIAFFPATSSEFYGTSGSLARFGPLDTRQDFYAPLSLPEGAVIDYVGLNTLTDSPVAIGTALYNRLRNGDLLSIAELSSTVHNDFDTEYNASPINFLYVGAGRPLIVRIEQGVFPTTQYFGSVEVWWRRSVSYNGGPATFNDVPIGHPFFVFVEALADSGITAGCGNGNFCPDAPLTRGQMAVFLAKAVGLHLGQSGPPS